MSANEQKNRPNAPESANAGYDDDMNLDLELERVIKHLDEATSEPSPSFAESEPPPEPKKPAAPTARTPVPVRDPRPPAPGPAALSPQASRDSDTVLLTDRLADSALAVPPPPKAKSDVIDLVDEIDDPYGGNFEDLPNPVRTLADLTPEELGDVVAAAVERALRSFFSR
ncbi:MAG: hypothetical protein LBE49_09630 [Deltaproteobacteria bacterium]|jgi:hypothetical protein|nr:hypothetical protein [Deltaproteobacteria bacterium]